MSQNQRVLKTKTNVVIAIVNFAANKDNDGNDKTPFLLKVVKPYDKIKTRTATNAVRVFLSTIFESVRTLQSNLVKVEKFSNV